ncbi:hypothetical protein ACFRCX_30825 [Streptomyces sp. NPDC056652]|uniref:hypothetical protein n=1 Tax=Streptomyces sp. NPDC056652 TaxID=3345893 RepID=UPI00369CDB99
MSARREWLAKVITFAFPRTFSVGPLPATDDTGLLLSVARNQHHVCFKVQLTTASKDDVGREVKVQIQADDAIRLGQQMIRVANFVLPAPREEEQTSPSKGDQVT